ncbi:protein of unknown function [Pseudomonas sp. LAMO17WK12:I10]|uniref:tyrosine-type recombinase/integrase n=1 Tax=unclassified Pseudomonas TaxID=196821 RepID=UPI000BC64B46|nr:MULTISPECIES: integrase arm-type DNA-binding domain-containing protein [unclassified Pseudomonas]PXX58927.1 uncharacterized protein DUF4102 [Pseudomonas sp. LAMO17WK12:I9]SNY48144.1 protein of unknown function [Pseudomonas sp. LAMO17WK12:I10]
MPLTALQVKNAAPRERDYGLADGGGLFLWIRAVGGKSWRFRFRLDGKQSHISLGTINKVTLAQARQLASDARQLVAQGRHPGLERKVARAQAAISRANTFKSLALEWHQHKSLRWSAGYAGDVMEAFELDIFPQVGNLPLTDIKPMHWLQVFRRIEARGALEKLRKVRQRCQEVYRFAIATGRAEYNPIADIGGALQTPSEWVLTAGIEPPEFILGLWADEHAKKNDKGGELKTKELNAIGKIVSGLIELVKEVHNAHAESAMGDEANRRAERIIKAASRLNSDRKNFCPYMAIISLADDAGIDMVKDHRTLERYAKGK